MGTSGDEDDADLLAALPADVAAFEAFSPENIELLTPPSVPDGYEHVDMGDSQGRIEAPPWDGDRPVPQPDCSARPA
jgi:hypothetical protein